MSALSLPAVTAAHSEHWALDMSLLVAYLIPQNLLKLVNAKRWQKCNTACLWYYVYHKQFQCFFVKCGQRHLFLFLSVCSSLQHVLLSSRTAHTHHCHTKGV